jgi:hypothetical protein
LIFCLEDTGRKFTGNFNNYLPDCTMSHVREYNLSKQTYSGQISDMVAGLEVLTAMGYNVM